MFNCLNLNSFAGVVLLKWIDPALLLSIYAIACATFALGVTYGPGKSGVGCLFALFFFESICYPVCLPRRSAITWELICAPLGHLHPRHEELGQTHEEGLRSDRHGASCRLHRSCSCYGAGTVRY